MDFGVTSRRQVRTFQGLGRRKMRKLIAQRLVSSISLWLRANGVTECKEGECLAFSYNVRGRGPVRYDFVFIKEEIKLDYCSYLYEPAVAAGSDHALIKAGMSV